MAPRADRLSRFAKAMRREPVANERTLWALLRNRRLETMKFRRQVPIGRYIVDFVCFNPRLIVEADGPTHIDSRRDRERDAWLSTQGFRILRFENRLIERQPQFVLDSIVAAARYPSPLAGEGGRRPDEGSPPNLPSPLAGEGGPRSGSDEGSPKTLRPTSTRNVSFRATPHPSASQTPSPARGEGKETKGGPAT